MMRKQYAAAFKVRVVQELLKEEKTLAQIATEYEVHPTQLKIGEQSRWKGYQGSLRNRTARRGTEKSP
jgi:transposase-like protein